MQGKSDMIHRSDSEFTPFRIHQRYISRVLLLLILTVTLSGCVSGTAAIVRQAQFDERAAKHTSIKVGATEQDIVSKHGRPKKIYSDRESGAKLLGYCDYGFTDSQIYGYFVTNTGAYYDGFLYRGDDIRDFPSLESKGMWEDISVPPKLNSCFQTLRIDWKYSPKPPAIYGWTETQYNIDLLTITHYEKEESICDSGGIHKFVLEGQVGPDSSFAFATLLNRKQPCKSSSGQVVFSPIVSFKSGGGFLTDGYKLGTTLREFGVTAVIESGAICASSCAVAFLGGTKRIVEDEGVILFHAPYYKGQNEYSSERVNCEVGDTALDKLLDYYQTITDKETGSRLFDRTMTYCSAEDGWVVTGGAAAELFGIATEK